MGDILPQEEETNAGQITQPTTLNINLAPEYYLLSEDRIRLSLRDHIARLENNKRWHTPLGIFLTILIIFPTTDFKDYISISADGWNTIFTIVLILSLIWLAISLYRALRFRTSIDEVINDLKRNAIRRATSTKLSLSEENSTATDT
jgi:uncharacterized membrane protein